MSNIVFIAENSGSGHRLVYVRVLVEGALGRGLRPILALTSSVLGSEEYERHLRHLEEEFEVVELPERVSVRELKRLAHEVGSRRVIIPNGNSYVLDLAFGPTGKRYPPLRVLMMSDPRWEIVGRTIPRFRTFLKLALFSLAEKRNNSEIVWLREPGHRGTVRHANDPVLLDGTTVQIAEDARRYRESNNITSDRFWFGVTGVISEAKQTTLIARAVVEAGRRAGRPVGLALLGPWKASDVTWERLTNVVEEDNLTLATNFVLHSNYEMNVAIRSLDCVVAAYGSVYGPSSTLGKTAALGVRSIGAGPESQQRFIERITGYPGIPIEYGELVREMVKRLDSAPPPPRPGLGPEQFLSALLD
ncbi:hypothetical protein [Flaviflexus equikiangi]|uniref:hypothetical protein n=1 Tax=Flaviflexus equikiangi TaxID=2758573 RepID=UPI0015F77E65|nr:hypothetical protein [Flaviflexus equikiangi]